MDFKMSVLATAAFSIALNAFECDDTRMNKNKSRIGICRHCAKPFRAKANRDVYCSLICRLATETELKNDADCWFWIGQKDKDGYGRLRWKWREIRAHVAAWQALRGPVPAGMCVLHRCDNPACVNIKHLWLGTVKDNNADRHAKGRTRCNPRAGDNGRKSKRNKLGQFKGMCGA